MNAESTTIPSNATPDSAPIAIEICDVWKSYRTGVIRGHTLVREFESLCARILGRTDPNTCVIDRASITAEATDRNVRFWAVQGVSFSVAKGEVVALLGKNGAGKSTLLQVLCRITEADRGVIRIRGKIASLLGAGVGFNDELTGRENVYLNGSILGMQPSEIASRMESIAGFAEIPEFMDTPVKRFSSGMRARLGFSVAVHLDADIMILDEVFATGDRVFRMKCIERIRDLAEGGRTILIVTHIPDMLKGFCRRGIVLDRGMQVFDGPIDAAIDVYGEALNLKEDSKGEVVLESANLVSGSGEPKDLFMQGEYFGLRLVFRSFVGFSSIGVAVDIGVPNCGSLVRHESPPGFLLGVKAGDQVSVTLGMESLNLYSCVDGYRLSARVFSGGSGSRTLFRVNLGFNVVNPDSQKGNPGLVYCPAAWTTSRSQ